MSQDIFNPKPFDCGRTNLGYDNFHRKPFDPPRTQRSNSSEVNVTDESNQEKKAQEKA